MNSGDQQRQVSAMVQNSVSSTYRQKILLVVELYRELYWELYQRQNSIRTLSAAELYQKQNSIGDSIKVRTLLGTKLNQPKSSRSQAGVSEI